MDSQHRHDLQQNELKKLTTKAVPVLEKYGVQLGAGVAGLAVLAGIGLYWISQSTASTAESWSQFDRVLHQPSASAGDYANIAEKHPGSTAAGWARLKEAEDFLKSGMRTAFSDKDVSQTDLKSAQEAFQKLSAGGPGITPEIRERALFGLARTLESMCDGKTEEVVDVYTRIIKEFKDSIFAPIANERIKALEAPDAKEFYAWFHALKPQPKDPHPFGGFKKPSDDTQGDEKSLDLDDQDATKSDGAGKPEGESKNEAPATSEKSDGAQPESEAKPSEEAKPSDEADKSESK